MGKGCQLKLLNRLFFYFSLKLNQFGFINVFGILILCLACSLWFFLRPQLIKEEQIQMLKIEAFKKSTPATLNFAKEKISDENKIITFHTQLGDIRDIEQEIQNLLALASKNNLVVQQANYKYADIKEGEILAYTIELPIKGTYLAVREFCEQFLLAVPFASLDHIKIKRELVGNAIIDVRLTFTLFMNAPQSKNNVQVKP